MRQTRRTRLLILDVDGTLLTDDYQITTATRAAVQQVAEWGVQVVLASARSPSALRRIMGTLGINGLAISYTGALTCRLSPDPHIPTEVITECRMSLSSARDVSRSAIAHGLSVGWFSGDNWYIPGWDEALCRESKITQTQPIVARNLIHFTEAPHKLL